MDGSGGDASGGERQVTLRSLRGPPLTSRCAARFLTGRGPGGLRTPALDYEGRVLPPALLSTHNGGSAPWSLRTTSPPVPPAPV